MRSDKSEMVAAALAEMFLCPPKRAMRSDVVVLVLAVVAVGFLCPPKRAMRSDVKGTPEGLVCEEDMFLCPPKRAMRSDPSQGGMQP